MSEVDISQTALVSRLAAQHLPALGLHGLEKLAGASVSATPLPIRRAPTANCCFTITILSVTATSSGRYARRPIESSGFKSSPSTIRCHAGMQPLDCEWRASPLQAFIPRHASRKCNSSATPIRKSASNCASR